jgi:hypothetical protein
VAKEKPARPSPQPAANAAPPPGLLRRLSVALKWLFASRIRGAIVCGALVLGIIGLAIGLTLALRTETQPAYVRQLAQAFGEFDKGNRTKSRRGSLAD